MSDFYFFHRQIKNESLTAKEVNFRNLPVIDVLHCTDKADSQFDTILVSHYSGLAWSFKCPTPRSQMSQIFSYVKKLKSVTRFLLKRPPIFA